MTGKKITNAAVKGRNSMQNAGNHQTMSAAKNAMKQMAAAAADPNLISGTFGNIPSAAPITAAQNAKANLSTLIKMSENSKCLPRYTMALSKPAADLFPAEELDGAQLELELLLSTVALRYRSLKSNFDSLDREDKNHKKNAATAPGKRKRDENTKKATKDAKIPGQTPKNAKVKVNAADSPAHSQHTDDSMEALPTKNNQTLSSNQQNPKMVLPKNDIPNKFWLSVEPYCMPITQEDIKMLDDMIEEYAAPLVPPIPELGPHYTARFAMEDIRDEQDNSNPNAKANKRFTNAANPEVASMLKKGEKSMSEGLLHRALQIDFTNSASKLNLNFRYNWTTNTAPGCRINRREFDEFKERHAQRQRRNHSHN